MSDLRRLIVIDYLWCFIDYFNCGINIGWWTPRRTGSSKQNVFLGSGFGTSGSQVLAFWVRGKVRTLLGSQILQTVSNHSRRTLWFAHLCLFGSTLKECQTLLFNTDWVIVSFSSKILQEPITFFWGWGAI